MERNILLTLSFTILLLKNGASAVDDFTRPNPDEFIISGSRFYTFDFVGYPLKIWHKRNTKYVYVQHHGEWGRTTRLEKKSGLQASKTNRTKVYSNNKVTIYYVDDVATGAGNTVIAVVPKSQAD